MLLSDCMSDDAGLAIVTAASDDGAAAVGGAAAEEAEAIMGDTASIANHVWARKFGG